MAARTLRIVDHADDLVQWAVRSIPEGSAIFLAGTREEAIAVADRHLLASPIGGLLQVYAHTGTLDYEVPYSVSGQLFVVQAAAAVHRESRMPDVPQERQTPSNRMVQQAEKALGFPSPPPEPAPFKPPTHATDGYDPPSTGATSETDSSYAPPAETLPDGQPAKRWPMAWVWPVACFVVLICFYGWTASAAFLSLVESGGSVESHEEAMWVAAFYTAPAVVSFFLISLGLMQNWLPDLDPWTKLASAGAVLLVAGAISNSIALSYAVDLTDGQQFAGNAGYQIFMYAVSVYINSWGIPTLVTAIALGVASAMSTDNIMRQHQL